MLFLTSIFDRFFVDLGVVLEGLGEVLGCIWLSIMGPQTHQRFEPPNACDFKGFGKGLGRVLGGFGDDFGRVLAGSGSLLGIPGPFQRRFGPVRLRVGGFEPLGVSKTIIWPMLRLLEPFFRVFFSHRFSSLRLHASTVLIIFRSSRSLLRLVFLLGSCWHFFGHFLECFFNIDFCSIFLRFWRGFGRQNGSQNRVFESFLESFFRAFIFNRFFVDLYVLF